MEASKKAYADMILNIGKEAASRIMVSERKALRFQLDLCSAKDEALRLLLRLKHLIDSKTNEAEMTSLCQQRKIEELEAQLHEAEDVIVDLRMELKQAWVQLEKVQKNQVQRSNKEVLNEDASCNHLTPESVFFFPDDKSLPSEDVDDQHNLIKKDSFVNEKDKEEVKCDILSSRTKKLEIDKNSRVVDVKRTINNHILRSSRFRKSKRKLQHISCRFKDESKIIQKGKKKFKRRDVNGSSLIAPLDRSIKPCRTFSYLANKSVKSGEDRSNVTETEYKMKLLPPPDPVLATGSASVSVKAINKSRFVEKMEDIVREEMDAAENLVSLSSQLNSEMISMPLMHSAIDDQKVYDMDNGSLLEYTFDRKRKTESMIISSGITSVEKNTAKRRLPELENSGLTVDSSRRLLVS